MEWIYTQTKVSGQVSLELALIMIKKERTRKFAFLQFQKQLVWANLIVFMDVWVPDR